MKEHGSEEWAILPVNVLSDGGGLDGRSTTRPLDRLERWQEMSEWCDGEARTRAMRE